MRVWYALSIISTYLILNNFHYATAAVLRSRSLDHVGRADDVRLKRQPSTPQSQGSLYSVPAPGSQSQDPSITSGTSSEPGLVANSPATNQGVNCSDLRTGRDNKCWEELQLTQWVEDWVDGHICYADEAFASCFLRIEGFPGLDCTGIKISACTAPQGDNLMHEPEVFYVAYNIYGEPNL